MHAQYDRNLYLSKSLYFRYNFVASKLLLNMDEKVDPCDDFYDFACGSFVKNTRIPDDKTSVNTFSIITDQLQEQIRALLDEPIIENEPRPFILAKTLYQACMNRSKCHCLLICLWTIYFLKSYC